MEIKTNFHTQKKGMPHTTALCPVGKLQVGHISVWNQYSLYFPRSHVFFFFGCRVLSYRSDCTAGVLLQSHLERRLVDGPENRCWHRLWAVWCWASFDLISLRHSICEGWWWLPPWKPVVSPEGNKPQATAAGLPCRVAGMDRHGATRSLFFDQQVYESIY